MVCDMPRVSQQYRDSRRAEILGAAKRCFVRDGFHATSMQDVFAESGLSAGAVYRYFPSKDAMILAIAGQNIEDVLALIRELAVGSAHDPLGETLARILDVIRDKMQKDAIGPIALLVWAEAIRNPAIAGPFRALLNQIQNDIATVVASRQDEQALPSNVPADGAAALFLAVVAGFIVHAQLLGGASTVDVPDAARSLIRG